MEKRGKGQLLDERTAFMAWYEAGTQDKAALELARQGLVNPSTGQPYTSGGIWSAAGRFILKNSDEARQYFIRLGASGALDEEIWNKFLIKKAIIIWGTSRFKFFDWIQKMGFYQRYFDFFKGDFGLSDENREFPPTLRRHRKINLF